MNFSCANVASPELNAKLKPMISILLMVGVRAQRDTNLTYALLIIWTSVNFDSPKPLFFVLYASHLQGREYELSTPISPVLLYT